jgi:hypothetical protein
MKASKRIWPWLIVSFLVAAASCFGPRIYPYDPMLKVSVWLSEAWALFVLVGIICERKEGLWLLISAPLALFTPVMLILWERACRLNVNACP